MNRYLLTLLTLLSAVSFSGLHAQMPGTSPVKIYIMVGQSNMVGHGDISPVGTEGTLEYIVDEVNDPGDVYQFLVDGADWAVRDDVWFIDQNNANTGLTSGLGASSGKIGPELGFGHVIGDHHGEQVFIIKASWGGKSLAVDFRPPSSGDKTGFYYNLMTDIIDDAVANIGTYFPSYDGQGYEFAGFCWHQGYNDRVISGYDTQYETNMVNFINDIRDYLDVPNLPFVIATTGMGEGSETTPVEDAQLEMANAASYPEFAGNVSVIDTRNTTYLGVSYQQDVANSPANEGHHWNRNAMTYLHIGMAMGDAMAALPGPECPSRLEAIGDASGVTLTWQNGSEMPTNVQILRNGVEIEAVASVSPASYLDATAEPGVLNYEFIFNMPTATCDPLTLTFDSGITDLIGYRGATGVNLEWTNNLGYTNIEVRRDNVLLTTIAGTDTTYTDTTAPSTGSFTYSLVPTNGTADETAVVVDLGPPSAGDALVYEPFDYAIGGLNGQSGASETGLDGSWNAHSTTLVVPGSLTYSTLPTFGGSIGDLTGGNNRFGGARAISASALSSSGYLNDGATLWFSAIMGLQEGGNGTNSRLSLALANDQFNGGNYDYWIVDDGAQLGEGVGMTLVGNGGRVLAAHFRDLSEGDGFAGNVEGDWSGAGTTYQSGEYGLIVGKITWGAGATDTIEIYHPGEDMLFPASASSTLVVDVDQANFDTITFARGDKVQLDEIRFGASYASVVGELATPDTDPPTPNPAAFASAPAADSDVSISMIAQTGTDLSGPVEYLFTETSGNPGATSSDWQTSSSYTDTGLQASTEYSYKVQMRDSLGNTGTESASVPATTNAPDNDAPTPNPAQFLVAPAADSPSAISMTAVTGTDANPVEYLFTETTGNTGATSSGWQTNASYTDSGLDSETEYTYTVTMRDTFGNTGTESGPASATTLASNIASLTQINWDWLHAQNGGGNSHDISVYAGSAGYAGNDGGGAPTSGTFGDGAVDAYNFFTADQGVDETWATGDETLVSYASGGTSITGSVSAGSTIAGTNNAADIWTTTDPAGFTTTADYTNSTGVSGISHVDLVSLGTKPVWSGTIDISSYTSGSIYFLYGHYRGGGGAALDLDLTMKDADLILGDIQLLDAGSTDQPNNWEQYVVEIGFVNDLGYDTIDYALTFSSSAPNGRIEGIVLDGNTVGGPSSPYEDWADGPFLSTLTDPTADIDFDGGGLETGIEWVVGGDPTDGSDDASVTPVLDNTTDPDFLIFTYRRSDAALADGNTAIEVEYGTDLSGWTTAVAGADIIITPDDDAAAVGVDLVEVKLRRSTFAIGGKLFARLIVVVTP